MKLEVWTVFSVWVLVCAAGLSLTLYGELRQKILIAGFGKLVAATAYIAAALSLGAGYSHYGRFLLAGMLFCWAGDLLLVSKGNKRLFITGLTAFLLGHLFYSGAFLARGISPQALAIAALLMSVFAYRISAWLNPYLEGPLKLAVFAYILVISSMMAIAAATYYSQGNWALLSGALLFVISDLAVARNRFVAPGFINRAWGVPVYFTAQLLFAASVII